MGIWGGDIRGICFLRLCNWSLFCTLPASIVPGAVFSRIILSLYCEVAFVFAHSALFHREIIFLSRCMFLSILLGIYMAHLLLYCFVLLCPNVYCFCCFCVVFTRSLGSACLGVFGFSVFVFLFLLLRLCVVLLFLPCYELLLFPRVSLSLFVGFPHVVFYCLAFFFLCAPCFVVLLYERPFFL